MVLVCLLTNGCQTIREQEASMTPEQVATRRQCVLFIHECETKNSELWRAGIPGRYDCTCTWR